MVEQLNQPNGQVMPVGLHTYPQTDKPKFFWTGKVAIGIAHQRPNNFVTGDAVKIQELLLTRKR